MDGASGTKICSLTALPIDDAVAPASYPNGQTSAYTYFNNVGDRRLQTILHDTPSGTTLSRFDYTYNAVGDILTWQQQADTAPADTWTYGYDRADQLTTAVKTAADQTVLGREAYTYDPAGNRTTEQVDDVVTGATYDTLNRLTAHTASGVLRVAGTVSEPATVTVNGAPASVDAANKFVGSATLASGTNQFTVTAQQSIQEWRVEGHWRFDSP
ncbi:MAG: hypothetical protein KGN76_13845 [Acidobacteriota bacterium]|nr:hypothetical protein [Acidobacteriota bacterium]